MQNVEALDVRRLVTGDERVRMERDGVGAGIGHLVVDREHVFVVDRDRAGEFEPLAVVVGQCDWRILRERRLARGRPQRVGSGERKTFAADEARLGVIGVRAARGRQEHDLRARRLDRLAIVLEREIVDAAALQRDRAFEARRVDGDARAFGERLLAGERDSGGARLRRGAFGRASALRRRLRRPRLDPLLLLCRLLRVGRRRLRQEQDLPGEQDAERQENGEDEVAVVLVHVAFNSRPARLPRRER